MSLDRLMEALLYRRSLRQAFVRGDFAPLEATAAELEALATIDRDQLERAARLACDGILRRAHRGSGSLLDAFSRTIAAWSRSTSSPSLDDLSAAFAESAHFACVRALPTCDGGMSLEEAFFLFAEDAGIGDAPVRKAELVCALVRALVATPNPSFALPSFVRRAPRGYFAILDGPELVAALGGNLVQGRITPLLAALLEREGSPQQMADSLGVHVDVVAASCAELGRLGLR